jgi:hypothetical protein
MEEPPHNPYQKTLFRALAGTLLLIGFGVFYYFVIFLPHQASVKAQKQQAALDQQQQAANQQQQLQQQKLDQENQQKLDQAAALQDCLDTAGTIYQANWATACTHYGLFHFACPHKSTDKTDKRARAWNVGPTCTLARSCVSCVHVSHVRHARAPHIS